MPTVQHLFSTGTLSALASGVSKSLGLSKGAPTLIDTGPTTPSTTPLSNLVDGNPATTATLNHDAGGFEVLIIDFGSQFNIAGITLQNVSVPNATAVVAVNLSDTLSTTYVPGFFGNAGVSTLMVAVEDVPTLSGTTLAFTPSTGNYVNARYAYVCVTASGGTGGSGTITGFAPLTIGEISYQTYIPFAVCQDAEIELKWDCHELFTAASLSEFPIDIGVGESSWKMTVKNVGVQADSLQQIVAAQLSISGSEANITLPSSISMPSLRAVLQALDTSGNPVQFTMNNAQASGAELPFKLNDFVVQGFALTAFPDVNGVMGSIVFG